ncbi:MAG: hypothetical protein B7Z75_03360 [Acidocella sp. 20-57-95]|nr:MAG: hypothetical protein B7Z75_03360 [Acidocella sp. 20-57-95]OYV59708.1 MAG: hypothetical protein B7Z71_07535 [Acidocella sp. 21-58-7]HQT64720.1 hypothetical protein [Acidocella sp.]HQU03514.1 hypothetical protein [Acidocella sp.]
MRLFSRPSIRSAVFAASFMAIGALTTGAAMAYQGHMHEALESLYHARGELVASEDNKGGHRDEAIRLVNAAIEQVRAGIAYADH